MAFDGRIATDEHMYRIYFMNDETEVATVPWGSDLTLAKNHARDHLPAHRRQGGATLAKVFEVKTGQLVYQFPEG